jgi:hypothetical protein
MIKQHSTGQGPSPVLDDLAPEAGNPPLEARLEAFRLRDVLLRGEHQVGPPHDEVLASVRRAGLGQDRPLARSRLAIVR